MSLSFTCLNLWMGGKFFEPIVEFLQAQDSDIIALQEVYEQPETNPAQDLPTLAKLNERLEYPHAEFAPALLDCFPEGDILNGNAVLSKHPIRHTDVSFLSGEFRTRPDPTDPAEFPRTPRNLQHTAIETPVGMVNLFNFQGVWDLNGDNDSPQRRTMVARIIEATKGQEHVIIAGDTNARPSNPAMQPLEQNFTNVFGTELTTTFNMRHKKDGGYATSVVDLIYVTPDIKVLEHDCPDADVSDHLPLTMRFELI